MIKERRPRPSGPWKIIIWVNEKMFWARKRDSVSDHILRQDVSNVASQIVYGDLKNYGGMLAEDAKIESTVLTREDQKPGTFDFKVIKPGEENPYEGDNYRDVG